MSIFGSAMIQPKRTIRNLRSLVLSMVAVLSAASQARHTKPTASDQLPNLPYPRSLLPSIDTKSWPCRSASEGYLMCLRALIVQRVILHHSEPEVFLVTMFQSFAGPRHRTTVP